MRFSVLIIILIAFTFNSCKKIKGDAKEIEGTYEWAYSYTSTSNGDHGATTTVYDYPTDSKRIAIKIEKRKVIFFENGKEIERFSIQKIYTSEEYISLTFPKKKGGVIWYKESLKLYSSYCSNSIFDHHVFYKN